VSSIAVLCADDRGRCTGSSSCAGSVSGTWPWTDWFPVWRRRAG